MNIAKLSVLSLIVAVVLAAGWFIVLPRIAMTQTASQDVYYCPMHPSYTSDRPGKCPICNMELVKRKKQVPNDAQANDHQHGANPAGYSTVHLDEKQRQLTGVQTAQVKKETVSKMVHAVGYVAHNVDLYKVQNEFIDAYRKYVTVYRDYRRFADRRRNWETHRQLQTQLLEAEHELTQLGLGDAEISKLRDIKWWRSWDQPELAIYRDSNNYWIFAQVFERDLGFIEIGQNATVNIPSYHEEMHGVIRSIGGNVDPETRTVRVLIEIMDYRGELKANMLAYVDILSELGNHLVVPSSAVLDLGPRKIVFMDHGQGVFVPVDVDIAFQGDGYWAIDKGIKEGDRIVVAGNFLLDSESRMRSQLMADEGSPAGEVDHAQH